MRLVNGMHNADCLQACVQPGSKNGSLLVIVLNANSMSIA